jgi:hypothetical protein
LRRDLDIIVFLEGNLDEFLKFRIFKDLKPLQVPERNFDRLDREIRACTSKLRGNRILGTLVVRAGGAAANHYE